MKFIHTADLHLDSPFDNLRNDGMPLALWHLVYQSTYRSFARITQAAIKDNVDLVLIVGDLFDRQDRNVKAQSFLKRQLEILNQHDILALISFGNHDYFAGDYQTLDYPSNTYVFPNKVTTKHLTIRNQRINVTGFSYGSRWETNRMINQFPDKGACDYQIGMIHGQISSGDSNYTPFTLNELLSKHYDYWALGHVHKRKMINSQPPVVYPGNIQGRNPNETGEKGYLLVDSQDQFKPQFRATSLINWTTVPIKVKSASDEAALVDLILQRLAGKHFKKMQLVDIELRINSFSELSPELNKFIYNQNLLDQVQAALRNHYHEVKAWVYHVDLKVNQQNNLTSVDSKLWNQSSLQVFNINNVDKLAKKLFQYPFINRQFNNPRGIKRLKQQIIQSIANHRSSQHED